MPTGEWARPRAGHDPVRDTAHRAPPRARGHA